MKRRSRVPIKLSVGVPLVGTLRFTLHTSLYVLMQDVNLSMLAISYDVTGNELNDFS
jgi:hypothetical protein